MSATRTRLAATLGWAASLALHLTAGLSALGVIPLAQGLEALGEELREDSAKPETPPEKKAPAHEKEVLKAAPPPEPPAPPAPQPPKEVEKPVEVRVPDPEPLPEEPVEIKVGIDESTATDTDTWLGFAEATAEHGGMVRDYEQAQLTRAPGERGARMDLPVRSGSNDAPARAQGVDAQRGEAEALQEEPHETPGDERAAFVAAGALPTITLAREEASITAPGAGLSEPMEKALDVAQAALDALRGVGVAGTPGASGSSGDAGARAVDETAQPAADAEPLDGGAGGDPHEKGFLSDRDSDAAAIRDAISVNPGKPLAAKGLRIQTVRPKWSTYAIATARPNDVVVRIWFDWMGRVTKATIIQSSGRDDVDRPILDAVYNWRAAGAELAKIKERPDQRVQLVFKIDLGN